MTEKQNPVAELLAAQLQKLIEADESKWEKPWVCLGADRNIISKKHYRGINALLLPLIRDELGFNSSMWGTYKQWQERGTPVKKGMKGSRVIFWKPLTFNVEVKNDEGETEMEEKETFMARIYTVFNGNQCEGYDVSAENNYKPLDDERNETADKYFERYGIPIIYGGNSAFYVPSKDEIHLPEWERFNTASEFYSTLAHESIHSTGAKHRLDRKFNLDTKHMNYAIEELVADIGAGLLVGKFGYAYQFSKNNLAYLKSWFRSLKNEPKLLIKACSHAQKAVDYLDKVTEFKDADEASSN